MVSHGQRHRGNTAWVISLPVSAAHFCPSAVPQCLCWATTSIFALCILHEEHNHRRDNVKKKVQKGQERKVKLLLVSWIVSLISFLTHHTSVHVANKTPGRKKSTLHHLPLLPKSYLSSTAVITLQQLPNTFFSFMKLMSPQINAECIICFLNLQGIWFFYFDVQTYVRMHSTSSPFDELEFPIMFNLFQDIFQWSG